MKTRFFGLIVVVCFFPIAALAQWSPPIGIPQPPFGINETHHIYNGVAGYSDAGNGPFTHYVDNTAAGCSDATNGTVAQPRCTIPLTLAAGNVVEVHGGPYTQAGGSDTWTFNASGTASQPIFIRGVSTSNRALIDGRKLSVLGSYVIFENFEVTDGKLSLGALGGGDTYLAARGNLIHDGASGNFLANTGGTDVVLYNNEVHHNFKVPGDGHGMYVGRGSLRTWVVDNVVHHVSGNGIQFCHACSTDTPDHIYVGRNTFYHNRETGIGIKWANNVILSQNIVHSQFGAPANEEWCFEDNSFCGTWSSGTDGSGIIVGADGGPTNTWVIYNKVYSTRRGIRNEDSFGGTYFIGNLVYDVEGQGIVLEKEALPIYIVNNTIDSVPIGIDQTFRNNFEVHIHNNIFNNISNKPVIIESGVVSGVSTMSNNLFWNGGSSITIEWNNNFTYSSTAEFASFSGGSNNIIAAPQFTDEAADNFQILATSPAVDAGSNVLQTYNATFQSVFGTSVSILRDIDNKPVPQDGNSSGTSERDIGAYEVGTGGDSDSTRPAAPGNLRPKS